MNADRYAASESHLNTCLQVNYALYAAGACLGVTPIIAIIVAYIKRDDAEGTWLASHFRWQIRTFWWGSFWCVVGFVSLAFLVGLFVLPAAFAWMLYRVIKGWIYLVERRPMYAERGAAAPAIA